MGYKIHEDGRAQTGKFRQGRYGPRQSNSPHLCQASNYVNLQWTVMAEGNKMPQPKHRDHPNPTPKATRGSPSESCPPKDTGEPGLEASGIEYGESRAHRQQVNKEALRSWTAGCPKEGQLNHTGVCEQSPHASEALGA